MENVTKYPISCKGCTQALQEERVQQVLAHLRQRGGFLLDADQYRDFRSQGLTNRQVDRAIAVLKANGHASVEASTYGLDVELIENGEAPCEA